MLWLILQSVIFLAFYYVRHLFNYWTRIGFPQLPSSKLPYGSIRSVIKQKQSMGELFRDIHLQHPKTPYLGIYQFFRPALMIRDPVLIKRVLISDFDCFISRGVYHNEKADPIGFNLFNMPSEAWKNWRVKLSPTFTSGKLKNMFHPVAEKTLLLKHHLDTSAESELAEVPLKRALIRLNLSIIASTFFGFELNAFEDPEHEFNIMGDMFFDNNSLRNKVINICAFLFPKITQGLNIPLMPPVVSGYVRNLVNSVVEARTKDPSLVRPDFIQTVMDMMAGKDGGKKISVEQGAAQAFVFYLAGYETSATTTAFCMHELSKSPEWLAKARAEVDELMEKRKGQLQYEDLMQLKVVDKCIKEAMRMYPALPFLNRECNKDYPIPGTNLVIPKGMPIVIPAFGLHMDPEFYPNPEIFDPSRFDTEEMGIEHQPFYAVST